jgi:hypothetical protein
MPHYFGFNACCTLLYDTGMISYSTVCLWTRLHFQWAHFGIQHGQRRCDCSEGWHQVRTSWWRGGARTHDKQEHTNNISQRAKQPTPAQPTASPAHHTALVDSGENRPHGRRSSSACAPGHSDPTCRMTLAER